MTQLKATHITWDIDNDEEAEIVLPDGDEIPTYSSYLADKRNSLPTEVDLPDGMTDEEEISDYLSDKYGYCHKGFDLEER